MKNITILVICLLAISACHRKTIPEKTSNVRVVTPSKKTSVPPPPKEIVTKKKKDSVVAVAPTVPAPTAMIVIDGYGKILTPGDRLPDSTLNPDYGRIARAFTPQELANLRARYKTVPPRVLYVPDQYAQKSLRGIYAVYKKKFFYWKKDDGLFYLDEIYYK